MVGMNDDFQLLSGRTFHPDEANQAFTTGRLLETGRYEYRPDDHHGPTLYYAAAALQKASGRDAVAAMDGTLLRCTPLLFAVLALVFGFMSVRKLVKPATGALGGWLAPCLCALLLGTAPIFVFFATDFIQEMLLACFTLAMFWAGAGYTRPGKRWKPGTWALLFGIAAGLAFATKETSLLAFAAAGLAGIPLAWRCRNDMRFEARDAMLALSGFALTAILLFSSFASNWQGVYNAFVAAPLSYLGRAAGSASSAGAADHVHPWWQYLKWLFFPGWRFSALPLAALFIVTFRRRSFMHLYAIAILVLYSLIPYKTPWCALQLLVPLAIAPFLAPWTRPRALVAIPLVALSLAANAIGDAAIARDPDSKDIPYNYASASPEVKQLAATVASAMDAAAGREQPFVAVALPPADTWPFPWYNRPYEPQTGYWTSFDDLKRLAAGGVKPTVVIVPMTEGHLVQPLFPHLKNTKRFFMRPGVRVRVFW